MTLKYLNDEPGTSYWLHRWVHKHLGAPDTCEHCGTSGLKGREIHWANKSNEYKLDLEDWLRLCAKCHRKYDTEYKRKYYGNR